MLWWIINSFYFEYQSPVRLGNNFINPIQSEMNIFVLKSERIRSDSDQLCTPRVHVLCTPNIRNLSTRSHGSEGKNRMRNCSKSVSGP